MSGGESAVDGVHQRDFDGWWLYRLEKREPADNLMSRLVLVGSFRFPRDPVLQSVRKQPA